MTDGDLIFASAKSTAARIARRELSARELMDASLAQIERLNPDLNAIVSMLDPDQCRALADAADNAEPAGPLHGIPIAFKDLEDAVGFPATSGSPIYRDYMPESDSAIVERLKANGAIPIGKTNVPEFGLGSHTYNPVFGPTRNPWNRERTAGGSSGGAAVAVATGMLPLADGSDMGGSLRNPGNFNNVVGFRPTPGLVPKAPSGMPWLPLSVKGPIARSVEDIGFFLSAMAGYDDRDQLSYPVNPTDFAGDLGMETRGLRIAFTPDLGELPLEPEVRRVLESTRSAFETLGCQVDDIAPDLTGADLIFKNLRAFSLTTSADLLRTNRADLKPEAIWNIEAGLKLSAAEVSDAMVRQSALFRRMHEFMSKYDAIVCAVNQVPPFPIDTPWPAEIDGVAMETYIDWMKSAYFITVTRQPAISVPAGFTRDGLPVGVQIVGRYRQDLALLKFAHAFEQATGFGAKHPPAVD